MKTKLLIAILLIGLMGCKKEEIKPEIMEQNTVKIINVNITNDTLKAGEPIYFTCVVEGTENIVWSFGDGFIESGSNVSHIYKNPGVYEFVLYAWDDENSCDYSEEIEIK